MSACTSAGDELEHTVWPFVRRVAEAWAVPGMAIAVVHGDESEARGFGTRTGRADEPVTAQTLFHLASISKTFVAVAAMRLVERRELDLERPLVSFLPQLAWVDPRSRHTTLGQLLSHTSGIGDVTDYGWHRPETDDGALSRFATEVAGWPLRGDPGSDFAYSNAAYELLGHLIATVTEQSFEDHLREHVLDPIGMTTSTFLRSEVPAGLGAVPHLGLPPRPFVDGYPYTRAHAPSSTLHSSAQELGLWMRAHLRALQGTGVMSASSHAAMWQPRTDVPDWGDFHQRMALGWFLGEHRGHAVVGHAGGDPGFETNIAMIPELGLGVAVLTNTNTAPIFGLTRGVLDALLAHTPVVPTPPVTVALGKVLAEDGVEAAVAHYRRAADGDPPAVDLEEEAFDDAAWGAVEMHRPELVADLLAVWREIWPESSQAVFTSAWADLVRGRRAEGIAGLRRALELDPDNDDAEAMLRRPPEPR